MDAGESNEGYDSNHVVVGLCSKNVGEVGALLKLGDAMPYWFSSRKCFACPNIADPHCRKKKGAVSQCTTQKGGATTSYSPGPITIKRAAMNSTQDGTPSGSKRKLVA